MNSSLRVAILIVNYNGENYLAHCLASLRKLTYPHFKVTVIDNASTDTSFIEAKNNFPECHFIQKESNTGFGSGMNTGIAWAEKEDFDFVWLLNPDTEVLPDSLSKLVEAQQKTPFPLAMSPIIKERTGKIWYAGGKINFWRMRVQHSTQIQSNSPYQTDFLTGCAPFISLKLLKKNRKF